jgi:anti-anti-sigma regulatory factor
MKREVATMLKISRRQGPGSDCTLKVEGALGGAWVSEFQSACDELLQERKRVVLDLSGVAFVDRAGTELLESLLADRRVAIEATSAFVAELLKGGAA